MIMPNTYIQSPPERFYPEKESFPARTNFKLNSRRAHRLSLAAGLVFLFLAANRPALATDTRLNLPQVNQTITLGPTVRSAAQEYFSHARKAGELPASLQNLLLHELPENFADTCASIVRQWGGEIPADTKVLSARVLNHAGDRAWLALRCGIPGDDRGPLYDERLALLHLKSFTLELMPLGADRDEEVYHIEYGRPLKLENAEVFSFRVAKLQNPCCEGPESRSQNRLMIFADTPRGAVESLSVLTARDDMSHCDDPEVDTEMKNRSEVEFVRDANGLETTVAVKFRDTVTDIHWETGKARRESVSDTPGTLRFKWNPATFKFDPTN